MGKVDQTNSKTESPPPPPLVIWRVIEYGATNGAKLIQRIPLGEDAPPADFVQFIGRGDLTLTLKNGVALPPRPLTFPLPEARTPREAAEQYHAAGEAAVQRELERLNAASNEAQRKLALPGPGFDLRPGHKDFPPRRNGKGRAGRR